MTAMYFWIDGPSIPTFPFDVVLTLPHKLPTYRIIYARDPLAQIPSNLLSEFTFSYEGRKPSASSEIIKQLFADDRYASVGILGLAPMPLTTAKVSSVLTRPQL